MYRRLEAAGIVSGYLVGFYDTARAMGERAVLDDLSQPAAARGVALRFSARADGRREEMTVDERTIEAIEDFRLTHLEAQVVQIIATRMGLDAASALGVWYGSDLCRGVELNEFGLQYLDASYLVDELMAREGLWGGA